MPKNNTRLTIVSILFVALFTTLGVRIIYLHTVKKSVIFANRRTFGRIKKLRGNIISSDGNIIASSIRGTRIFLKKDKKLTSGETKILRRMGAVSKLSSKNSRRKLLIKFLPPEETKILRGKNISKKLEFIPAQKRVYFDNNVYSPICGFTNYENDGASGIEYKYNKYLEGGQGEIIEIDATGKLLLSDDPDMLHAGGDTVKLTITGRLQKFLYRQLTASVDLYKAKAGYGIVMDPQTGKILAAVMAGNDSEKLLKNPIISDAMEPGSTFKIVTVAAAIENGLVKPEDKFFCENGSFEFAGIKITDHDPYDWLTVNDIIRFSSNIGASKIGNMVGKNTLYKTARDFGFGCQTGIKLPGEARGMLKRIDRWEQTSLYYISFGQEIAATPLQIAQSFAVIANGGALIKPRILESIISSAGKTVYKTKAVKIRRVITEKTAATVKEMLFHVVEGGTGAKVRMQGWQICGKTGTAQKFDTKAGKYSEDAYFASLGGFFPKENPEFVIFIALDEPREHYYGGTVCAEAFRRTAKEIIDIYGIAPARLKTDKKNET